MVDGFAASPGPAAPPTTLATEGAQATGGERVRFHVILALAYLAAGLAVTWPRVTYLGGKLPRTPDQASYVWGFWWVARQVTHLGNPWFTRHLAAPGGVPLGFDTLMPLPGVVMAPVTLAFGPAATYTLLTLAAPGAACYLMYRVAALWLPGRAGPVAAGAFYGLATMAVWQDWYHLNIALGAVCLPPTLEAAVRLRRRPGRRQAVLLGLVLGGCVLVNQESAVQATLLAALVLGPWLGRALPPPRRARALLARRKHPSGAAPLARGTLSWTALSRAAIPRKRLPWHALLKAGQPPPGAPAPDGQPAGATATPARATATPARATATPLRATVTPFRATALAAGVAALVSLPQAVAMFQQSLAGGTAVPPGVLAASAVGYGAPVSSLFTPSPRLVDYVNPASTLFGYDRPREGVFTFGLALTAFALTGLVAGWRRRGTRPLGLLWLASSVVALGAVVRIGHRRYIPFAEMWDGVRVSAVMPYTWLLHIPGMTAFREADRFALLGLVPAALLAGYAVRWLIPHSPAVLAIGLAVAALEAGYPGNQAVGTMPSAMPRVDAPIAASRASEIVVDVPFGLRGGVGQWGPPVAPFALVLATADGHPRGASYTSWVPPATVAATRAHAFYRGLAAAEQGQRVTPAQLRAAGADAAAMGVGWAVVWRPAGHAVSYLRQAGFSFGYRVGGIRVYRRE
jgi:hypothetical protein